MEAYRKLREWWEEGDSVIETEEIAEDRIVALERRFGIRLPADFREYLQKSSPVAGENDDDSDCCWWDFDRIRNIPEEFTGTVGLVIGDDAKHYLFFCDYAIWCWAWAICCAPSADNGKVALIGGGDYDTIVADSFSEFVQKYVTDWYMVSTKSGAPLIEIAGNVRLLAARIGVPDVHLPTFEASDELVFPYLEMDQNNRWTVVGLSGDERRSSRYYLMTMLWIFENVTFNMAFDYALQNRRPGEDFRRPLWTRQLELLGVLGDGSKKYRLKKIAATLAAHPFRDGGPADIEGTALKPGDDGT